MAKEAKSVRYDVNLSRKYSGKDHSLAFQRESKGSRLPRCYILGGRK